MWPPSNANSDDRSTTIDRGGSRTGVASGAGARSIDAGAGEGGGSSGGGTHPVATVATTRTRHTRKG